MQLVPSLAAASADLATTAAGIVVRERQFGPALTAITATATAVAATEGLLGCLLTATAVLVE